ncbi:MAG: hypothetical protein KGZ50_08920 [Peptococcaceae bacterium]|nr:hypothetical protein [Peptococcaceae bacterium]
MVRIEIVTKVLLWSFVLLAPAVVAIGITLYLPVAGREIIDLDVWILSLSIGITLVAIIENHCRIRRSQREEARNV